MGNCHTVELSMIDISENLDQSIEENLLYIKGLMYLFLEQKNLGPALKLLKIYENCKVNYHKTQAQRANLLSEESRLNSRNYFILERCIQKESEQLKNASDFLKKQFKSISGSWSSSTISKVKTLTEKVEIKCADDLQGLNNAYAEIISKNKHIDCAVRELNSGQDITPSEDEFIRSLCRLTTYIFNDKDRRVEYPSRPLRRSTEPETPRFKRKKQQTVQVSKNIAAICRHKTMF